MHYSECLFKHYCMNTSKILYILLTDMDDAPMIECSGPHCKNEWFHLDCINMAVEDAPDGDWYCSDDCRLARGGYEFCVCRKETREEMIGCDNPGCPRGSWFHFSCVGMRESDVPGKSLHF